MFGGLSSVVLAATLLLYFVAPAPTEASIRAATAPYVYAIGFGLVAYALFRAARSAVPAGKSVLVPTGFGALAVGQLSWVYWGVTDANAALLLAGAALPVGLALLTATVLFIWRGT